MAEKEGVVYSPARVDPYSSLEYADFSNVQYLEIQNSDQEQDGTLSVVCDCRN